MNEDIGISESKKNPELGWDTKSHTNQKPQPEASQLLFDTVLHMTVDFFDCEIGWDTKARANQNPVSCYFSLHHTELHMTVNLL